MAHPRSLSLSKGAHPASGPRSLSLSKGPEPDQPNPRSLSLSKGRNKPATIHTCG